MGAALAFRGIEGMAPFLHGSQGCAAYMRRYIISHFREPMDIASSSLGEKNAVFGGGPNLKKGLLNVRQKYGARIVGLATTCLTETIGDDVKGILLELKRDFPESDLPEIVPVSTPSFNGSHMDGWHAALLALVQHLTDGRPGGAALNLLPGFVSPADVRRLKADAAGFGLSVTTLPDISLTLDGTAWEDYRKLPEGGTKLDDIRAMGGAGLTIECGSVWGNNPTAGRFLRESFDVPLKQIGLPIGLRATDAFMDALSESSGREYPVAIERERGRLVDAYVDAHKYLAGLRAAVYGDEDLAVGLCGFLSEIGVQPVLAASGGNSGQLSSAIENAVAGLSPERPAVMEDVDFYRVREAVLETKPDILIGNGKGYAMARELGLPLVRVGFPIHDRFGAQRLLHVSYLGAQSLLDNIVNTILERSQADSPVGYGYL
jgi:nitrogenase molybdenum-iron protein NifN